MLGSSGNKAKEEFGGRWTDVNDFSGPTKKEQEPVRMEPRNWKGGYWEGGLVTEAEPACHVDG